VLRTGDLLVSMEERREFGVAVPAGLMGNEGVGLEHRFEPFANVDSLVPDFGEILEVASDLMFVPGAQYRLDVWEVLVQRRTSDAGLLAICDISPTAARARPEGCTYSDHAADLGFAPSAVMDRLKGAFIPIGGLTSGFPHQGSLGRGGPWGSVWPDNVYERGVSPGGESGSPHRGHRGGAGRANPRRTWSRARSEVFVPYTRYSPRSPWIILFRTSPIWKVPSATPSAAPVTSAISHATLPTRACHSGSGEGRTCT
jgi:hypothetical protein